MQTIKNQLKEAAKNWKTSLCGLIMVAGLILWATKTIDTQEFVSVIGAISAAGLFLSKDTTHN